MKRRTRDIRRGHVSLVPSPRPAPRELDEWERFVVDLGEWAGRVIDTYLAAMKPLVEWREAVLAKWESEQP